MSTSPSTASVIASPTGLDDPAYAALCHRQIAEAAQCVRDDTWRTSRFIESFTQAFVERAAMSRVFVDVGSERGFYTHLALRYMPVAARIIAIEPDPHRADALRRFFADVDSVTVIKAAAGSIAGTVTLFKNGAHSASLRSDDGTMFTTPSVVIDELADARDADLFKIDVEGAEADVLAGMPDILRRGRCHLYVEYHPWADEITPDARQRIRTLASECHYQITRTDLAEPDPKRLIGGRMILSPCNSLSEAKHQ